MIIVRRFRRPSVLRPGIWGKKGEGDGGDGSNVGDTIDADGDSDTSDPPADGMDTDSPDPGNGYDPLC